MQACGGSSPPFRTHLTLISPRTRMQSTGSIELLSPTVVEKIAAGEVVERPAAVVKELVENSIDAKATEIGILIKDAGFSMIKITDNGQGMWREDLYKCMLRHATSKIKTSDDLFFIQTFGFRGEALGSIAAVSKMSVISAANNDGWGYELKNEAGVIKGEAIPHAHKRGTTVEVRDLFYNVPARKKFMKTKRGEHLAIIRMLEQLVIPFPDIRFTLCIDDKIIFDLPVVERVIDRISAVAGSRYASSLIECHGERNNMKLVVYVTSPERLQERPRFQTLYVNLRRINSDAILYSVKEAYSRFLGKNQRPGFFCFLTINPSKIDVNVHPTKQLIKFDNEQEIFHFVFSTVKNGIEKSLTGSDAFFTSDSTVRNEDTVLMYIDKQQREPEENNSEYSISETVSAIKEETYNITGSNQEQQRETFEEYKSAPQSRRQTILSFPDGKRIDKEVDLVQDKTIQLTDNTQEKMWELIPCYQIHAMYILAPIKNGILLIDQHAAHERILFEQAMENSIEIRTTSQQLLFPIVLELTPAEKAIVESGKEYFLEFGFDITDFGGNAVSISAIPVFIPSGKVETTVREMLRYLLDGRNYEEFKEPQKRFAAAFACGAAIKAGQKLSQEEMNTLLNNLFSTRNPYICPHGRPTLIRMSIDEISRRFLR